MDAPFIFINNHLKVFITLNDFQDIKFDNNICEVKLNEIGNPF